MLRTYYTVGQYIRVKLAEQKKVKFLQDLSVCLLHFL